MFIVIYLTKTMNIELSEQTYLHLNNLKKNLMPFFLLNKLQY
jgi:hypothetical protein